jgi:hypothetical protein
LQGGPHGPAVDDPQRQWTAQTAAGALFTGAGVGLVGVLAGAIGVRVRQAEAMRDIFDDARTTGSLSDVDRSRVDAIKADGIQTARGRGILAQTWARGSAVPPRARARR